MKATIPSLFAFASVLLLSAVANAQATNRPNAQMRSWMAATGYSDGVVFGEAGHLAEVGVVTLTAKDISLFVLPSYSTTPASATQTLQASIRSIRTARALQTISEVGRNLRFCHR
jgi:hypothetical protein